MKNSQSKRLFVPAALLLTGMAAHAQDAAPVAPEPPSPAPAADAASADRGPADDGVGEVIVTARRVEEKLQDVPISITVFNQDQLNSQNVTSAADLAKATPSLSANGNFGTDNTTFAIRGFVQDPGTAPSVGTYFADVVAPRGPTQGTTAGDSLGAGAFFDLANVQVLKGPQGTLFGRNTTGGAVLLVPQKPTASTEGYLEGSLGNDQMRRIEGMFNTPLGSNLRFRVAADHQERDGYLRNIGGSGPSDYNDLGYTAIRASLVADVSANVENYTIASYGHSKNKGSVQKLIAANCTGYDATGAAAYQYISNFIGLFSCAQLADEKARGAGFYDVEGSAQSSVSEIRQWQVINTTTWNATDALTVKNIASYAEFKDLQQGAFLGANWQLGKLPAAYQNIFHYGVPPQFYTLNAPPGLNTANQSTYTEELQLQGTAFDSRLNFQTGVYLEWSDPLGDVGAQSPVLAPCTDVGSFACSDPIGQTFSELTGQTVHVGSVHYTVGQTSYRDQGVYLQSTYPFNEWFKVTGGIRYTWDEQSNDSTRLVYQFPTTAEDTATHFCEDPATDDHGCAVHLQEKSSAPTWLVDFDYTPTDDLLLYAKYARGYRAGGVFANAPSDLRIFDPEKVDNYELGFKSTFRGFVRGTFNVAAFYNDFSDQQVQAGFNAASAGGSPTNAIVNAGKSRITGVEVESTLVPIRHLTFQLSYTYLDAQIRKIDTISTSDPDYVPATSSIPPGTELFLSPKNRLSLGASYTLPLARIGRISLGLIYSYTSSQKTTYTYEDPANAAATAALGGRDWGQLAARDLLNANIGWEQIFDSPMDLLVFATNLANEKYYAYVPGVGTSSGGSAEFAALGEPRMYGARLRYRFGGS
ncbi:MAG: TonB-dependent receptor [Solimonas sp.]